MTCKKLGKNIAIAGACGVLYGYMYLAFQSDMSDEMRICMHNMAHAVSMLSGAVVGALL
jgi:hypothetical protein